MDVGIRVESRLSWSIVLGHRAKWVYGLGQTEIVISVRGVRAEIVKPYKCKQGHLSAN